MASPPVIEVRDLTKRYGRRLAVDVGVLALWVDRRPRPSPVDLALGAATLVMDRRDL